MPPAGNGIDFENEFFTRERLQNIYANCPTLNGMRGPNSEFFLCRGEFYHFGNRTTGAIGSPVGLGGSFHGSQYSTVQYENPDVVARMWNELLLVDNSLRTLQGSESPPGSIGIVHT